MRIPRSANQPPGKNQIIDEEILTPKALLWIAVDADPDFSWDRLYHSGSAPGHTGNPLDSCDGGLMPNLDPNFHRSPYHCCYPHVGIIYW